MAETVIVALGTDWQPYKGTRFRTAFTDGVEIGEMAKERTGVSNRRGAVCHAFTASAIAEMQARFTADGVLPNFSFLSGLPNDWRFQLVVGG